MVSKNIVMSLIGLSLTTLSACAVASGYSESEQEMVSNLTPSKYQPATRQMRSNIETQDILAQAAFWSREYQLNPADLESAVKLSAAVRKMGNPSKAVEITQTTRAMFPNDPYLIAEHSAALIALERGSEAVKPLDGALRAAPGYARLWSLKGAALDQMGEYDLARKHYNKALQINPQDPNVMANMGLSFALDGDAVTAEKWLRNAASHPDASTGVKQNYDLVLQLLGKPAQFSQPIPQAQAPRAGTSYQPPASQAPLVGHRSNMTVIGNQAGAPSSAAEMARAAASKSTQNKVVIPHQPSAAPQGTILDQIARSINGKQAAAIQTPRPVQRPVPLQAPMQAQTGPAQGVQRQGSAYPNPYARRAPQQPQIQYSGYPVQAQANQQAPTDRRGAARRR